MSVNESNSVDAFGVQAPSQPAFRVRSLAARALLFVVAFIAALATITFLVMATISQMQWQRIPEDVDYPRPRTTPLPPSNRPPTPADVGDIDQTGLPQQQQYRPGLAPGYQPPSTATPYLPPSTTFTPSVPVAPGSQTRPRPAPHAETPEPEAAPRPAPPPRASASRAETPVRAGGYRRVAGKTFKQEADGFLVDTLYRPDSGLEVVEVAAGSPECARLLEEHKDLAQYFRLSDRLVVVAGDVVYRVVP